MNEVVSLAASDCLRVVFEQRGDRWAHRVEIVLPDGEQLCFTSEEGVAEDSWPPSPALQSLDLQELPAGRRIAFLVGMAGSSHWSAAIEARRDTAEIHFDIACRCAIQPVCLGSQYRVEMPSGRMLVDAADHFNIQQLPAGHLTALSCDDGQVAIRVEVSDAAPPCTIRWRFAIS